MWYFAVHDTCACVCRIRGQKHSTVDTVVGTLAIGVGTLVASFFRSASTAQAANGKWQERFMAVTPVRDQDSCL